MDPFTNAQFERYSTFISDNFGIKFKLSKKEMLQTKLNRLLERNGIWSYEDYFRMLKDGTNRKLINELISEITVNKTDFFRENSHFEFIKNNTQMILQKNSRILRLGEIRVWCAACATGEEAYTLAMVLKESFPGYQLKILATDLDPEVLQTAVKGEYPEHIKNDIDRYYLTKYFYKTESGLQVRSDLQQEITFRQFNLMHDFPFRNGFDIIFCRNVMIYFDTEVQYGLLRKFFQTLMPGGLLFLGHTEGITNRSLNYRYLQPAVYMK